MVKEGLIVIPEKVGVTYLDKVTNDYIRESREIHEIG